MKKFLCVILGFFLSLTMFGCSNYVSDISETYGNSPDYEIEPEKNSYSINGAVKNVGDYSKIEEAFLIDYYKNNLPDTGITTDKVFVCDASELTEDMLKNRQGNLVIERCIGIVTNKKDGDGQILNCNNEKCYISYSGNACEGFNLNDGTILISYMIYNPDTNYIDDVIERYDFILCREYED